jgi:hypothetical protein
VEERLTLRQREAEPVWTSMRAWLDGASAGRVLPRSKLAEERTTATPWSSSPQADTAIR